MINQIGSTQQKYNFKDSSKQNISFGSRKIPRFLYHLTTKSRWVEIQTSGKLLQGNDKLIGKGVFMADLTNFFTQWKNFNVKNLDLSLLECLMHQVSKDFSNLVILKIKTDDLPKRSKFLVRDQAQLIKLSMKEDAKKLVAEWRENGVSSCKELMHSVQGDNARNARKYRKKTPIEYIYQEVISAKNIEKIGELEGDPSIADWKNSLPKIWKSWLGNSSEAKAVVKLQK